MTSSYVLWREYVAPLIALEFASGDGSEERDKTPLSRLRSEVGVKPGKFWVYERIIRIPYYGIYQIKTGNLEVYNLVNGFYRQMNPNQREYYPIEPLGIELGLWQGSYQNQTQLWLRWWDKEGNLLLTGEERAKQAEQAQREAIPRLLKMGLSVEQVAEALSLPVEMVKQESLEE
ncbi:MAG: Uma2 family endonuclease [Coleofasciculaceae cyanobacterium]